MAKAYRTRFLLALSVGASLGMFNALLVTPASNSLGQAFGLSADGLGSLLSTYTLAFAAGAILLDWAVGDGSRRPIFLLAAVAVALGSLTVALAVPLSGLLQFLAPGTLLLTGHILQAVGGGGLFVMALSFIIDTFPAEKRWSSLKSIAYLNVVGFVFGALLGSSLLSQGWEVDFFLSAGLAILVFYLGLGLPATAQRTWRPFSWFSRAYYGLGLYALLSGLTRFMGTFLYGDSQLLSGVFFAVLGGWIVYTSTKGQLKKISPITEELTQAPLPVPVVESHPEQAQVNLPSVVAADAEENPQEEVAQVPQKMQGETEETLSSELLAYDLLDEEEEENEVDENTPELLAYDLLDLEEEDVSEIAEGAPAGSAVTEVEPPVIAPEQPAPEPLAPSSERETLATDLPSDSFSWTIVEPEIVAEVPPSSSLPQEQPVFEVPVEPVPEISPEEIPPPSPSPIEQPIVEVPVEPRPEISPEEIPPPSPSPTEQPIVEVPVEPMPATPPEEIPPPPPSPTEQPIIEVPVEPVPATPPDEISPPPPSPTEQPIVEVPVEPRPETPPKEITPPPPPAPEPAKPKEEPQVVVTRPVEAWAMEERSRWATITDFSLRRRSVVILLLILTTFGGTWSAQKLSTELLPNLTLPVASVFTVYPGTAPQNVLDDVTIPIENAIAGTKGLKSLQSISEAGVSMVVAEFEFGTNMRDAVATINQNMSGLKLPQEALQPKVAEISLDAMPIIRLGLIGDDLAVLQDLAEKEIEPALAGIDGVQSVQIAGGNVKQIEVLLDAGKMADKHISASQVVAALKASNISIPSGDITDQQKDVPIVTSHKLTSLKEIEDLVIAPGGAMGGAAGLPRALEGTVPPEEPLAIPQTLEGADPSGATEYVVQSGDTLSAIAQRFYGDPDKYGLIFDANRDQLSNPNVIVPGQRLRIPAAPSASPQPTQTPGPKPSPTSPPATSVPATPVPATATRSPATATAVSATATTVPASPSPRSVSPTAPVATATAQPSAQASATKPPATAQPATPSPKAQSTPSPAPSKSPAASPSATAPAIGITTPDSSPTTQVSPSPSVTRTMTVIPTMPPAPTPPPNLRLKDIGEVRLADATSASVSQTNGQPSIGILVFKTADANTVKIADEVASKFAALKPEMGKAEVVSISDQSTYIKESIDGLMRESMMGAGFAVLIIFIFLMSLRSTLVAAISIPVSVLVALVAMNSQNMTLNIMTLGGLAVAIGRVVDDSIVILENIYRHARGGENIKTAARTASSEVAAAITISTLTTVAVFLPLAFIKGIVGQVFAPFALTVTFALLASLVVALTLVPVLATFFVRATAIGKERDSWIQTLYTPMIRWSLRHRFITLTFATILVGVSLAILPLVGTTFLPTPSEKQVQVKVELPAGSDIKTTQNAARQIEDVIAGLPDKEVFNTTIGNTGSLMSDSGFGMGNSATADILVRLNLDADIGADSEAIRAGAADIGNGATVSVSGMDGAGMGSSKLEVVIAGENYDKVSAFAKQVEKALQSVDGLANIENDISAAKPEVSVKVNPEEAIKRGLTPAQIGLGVREMVAGQTATRVDFEDKAMDVFVRVRPEDTQSVDKLKSLRVGTINPAPLSDIAEVSTVDGPVRVTRRDRTRAVTVSAGIMKADTGSVTKAARTAVESLQAPTGIEIQYGGIAEQQTEGFSSLGMALLIAVGLVYIVMVATMGSLLEPLIILISLPLAAIGAILSLYLTGRTLGMSALIGLLMLIGIVVTNAVVLLDLVRRLRAQGMPVREALVEGGRTRIRPILMTAIATILALTPLALGFGRGSIIAAELATVVIGGLFTSTFLTLIIVPVVYSILIRGSGEGK